MEMQMAQNSKTNVKKREHSWGFILSECKTYYKHIVTETIWYQYKDRQIDQWKGMESIEINLYIYDQIQFDKGAKTISMRKE